MQKTKRTRLGALGAAVSVTALSFAAGLLGAASAQEVTGTLDDTHVVPRDGLGPNTPPPGGIADNSGIIGIGQVVTSVNPPTGSVGTCTGTLINPRTVIFAAHCVNTRAASAYGAAQGGVGLSVGFASLNQPALIDWLFNPAGAFRTNTALGLYNANQVWYDPRSLNACSGTPPACFLQADIALATLDTPAFGVPTWALLFSPLTDATHVTMVGYGRTGSGTAGDNTAAGFRRRAAENMLDSLASINARNTALGGVNPGANPPGALPASVYSLDFDDPLNLNPRDFNIYPDGGDTPNEGITAPGDSGGPLIVDQAFDIDVVAGVLSGGTRFNTTGGVQPPSSYGTTSFYQPLFMYWDVIVQNNPYRYASALEGDGDWFDASHWVQDMDPMYMVIRDGELANDLPDTPAVGVSGATTRFGNICNGAVCIDVSQSGPGENSTGPGLVIPGGPGSTGFVPNNIEPDRFTGIQARYYDITLSRPGETWLSGSATIDRFSMINGYATLDVQAGGSLSILGDANIGAGLLNVDGTFRSGEMLLVMGILTGMGTVDPFFLTSVAGAIAPNGVDVGTLTIQGDVVLASGSQLFIEVGRNGADQLRITADPLQGTFGDIMLGGDLRLVKAANGPAPRHGQIFTIVLADGQVTSTFDRVFAQTGVLRPEVTYLSNAVEIELRAGKFADVIEGNVHELAFAHALDALRDGSYNLLYDLYGELDVMDFGYLNHAFSSLAPSSLFDANSLLAMQDSGFSLTLQNRMALLSRSNPSAMGLSVTGSPGHVFAFGGGEGLGAAGDLAYASALAESHQIANLPNGMSAFFSGGFDDSRASPTSQGRSGESTDSMRTWNMVGGLEHSFGGFTLGIAAGYSEGAAMQAAFGAQTENSVAQTAAYGVYRFDNGAYVSGLVGTGSSRASMQRRFVAGALDYRLAGDVEGDIYLGSLEVGFNYELAELTLTPNASVRHYTLRTASYTEEGGEAALAFDEQSYDRAEARLGLRFAGERMLSGWRISPTLDASFVANLSGAEDGVWARFAEAQEVSFYLPGAARDAYWGEIIGGLRMVRNETSFALSVETSVGREEQYEDRYVARYATRF